MWCVPRIDDEYRERMEDILDLYERPLIDDQPVVCLDEKPVVLHGDTRPCQRKRNAELRRDYEYRRLGTANAFCCVEPLGGRHMIKVTATRDKLAFAEMMRDIADAYPAAKVIHCVLDNLNTHSVDALIKRFGEHEGLRIWHRFRVRYTPKHASWLNQAEIEISLFSRECLGKRRFDSLTYLAKEARHWELDANRRQRRINWRFTSRDAKRIFQGEDTTKVKRAEY